MSTILGDQIRRRRTFAIISHPDAGKTTLTEKLLLYGGAIRLAGAVRAKSSQRHTTSDWMEIERQRGISISSSVLRFEYMGIQINLLDTPGHKDFSEDTYRTLVAADAAVMLIDAAKGIELQTRKLFEVCRLREIPIFTFINKMDRPGRDPLDLIDELEKILGIRACPMNWPIGMGDRFKGIYDRESNDVLFFQKEDEANVKNRLAPRKVTGINDEGFLEFIGETGDDLVARKKLHREFAHEIELLEVAGDSFDREKVAQGLLTPVFFGSAMNNFGVERFLQRFIDLAPAPTSRKSNQGDVAPESEDFSGFIFKIQANMDPQHRDRVVFMRVSSGRFFRGIEAWHTRLDKEFKLTKSFHFFAQDREIIEEAWPGDIVGLIDTTGDLRIGDTLSTVRKLEFEGVPRFSPEHFASVVMLDAMKRKQLMKGLDQLSEEGVVQVFRQPKLGDMSVILGAVGVLQFEILQQRLKSEYGVEARFEKLTLVHARWVAGEKLDLSPFENRAESRLVEDRDGQPLILFKSDFSLRWAEDKHKSIQFLKIAPMKRASKI